MSTLESAVVFSLILTLLTFMVTAPESTAIGAFDDCRYGFEECSPFICHNIILYQLQVTYTRKRAADHTAAHSIRKRNYSFGVPHSEQNLPVLTVPHLGHVQPAAEGALCWLLWDAMPYSVLMFPAVAF